MLLQSPLTLPPPGFAVPSFSDLARLWDAQHERDALLPSKLAIGPATVTLGHRDLEAEDALFPSASGWETHEFGWDNEHGVHQVEVGRIEVERKPISNGEYRAFLEEQAKDERVLPGSWIEMDGEWMVSPHPVVSRTAQWH